MLSDYQFNKYLYAHLDATTLKDQYEQERLEAYENVSPTMTIFNYGIGQIVSGSVSVEDHAVYLAEIYERFSKKESKILKRAELLNEAISLLYDDEKAEFEAWKENPRGNYPNVLQTLKECLSFVLERVTHSEKIPSEMTVDEWDAAVDEMSEDELFQDYYDLDDTFDMEIVERRALIRERGRASNAELEGQAC